MFRGKELRSLEDDLSPLGLNLNLALVEALTRQPFAGAKPAQWIDYGGNGRWSNSACSTEVRAATYSQSYFCGGTMSLATSPALKVKLVGKRVIVKVSLFSRAFPGTVAATDETGFSFLSDEMVTALREITGSAMASMDAPQVYLPYSSLEWLVFSDAKTSAASA